MRRSCSSGRGIHLRRISCPHRNAFPPHGTHTGQSQSRLETSARAAAPIGCAAQQAQKWFLRLRCFGDASRREAARLKRRFAASFALLWFIARRGKAVSFWRLCLFRLDNLCASAWLATPCCAVCSAPPTYFEHLVRRLRQRPHHCKCCITFTRFLHLLISLQSKTTPRSL